MKLSEIKITPITDSIRMLDMSDKEYFGDGYSEYISNSRLNLLKNAENEDPTRFFEGIKANSQFSDSLFFGSAIHGVVLQPENYFIVDSVDRPTAKAGLMADELYRPDGEVPTYAAIKKASEKIDYYKGSMDSAKADALKSKCRDYWKARAAFEKTNTDKREPIFMPQKDRERLNNCLDALSKNEAIQKLLHPTGLEQEPIVGNEQVLLLDVKVEAPGVKPFVLKLKSKLDNFSIDLETNTITVNDLKTTGKYISEFGNAVNRFSYYREMAMYCWLLALYTKKKYSLDKVTVKSNFLVVETFPGYYTTVYPMTKPLFKKGIHEFTHLLKLVAFYCCHGFEEFAGCELLESVENALNEGSGEDDIL